MNKLVLFAAVVSLGAQASASFELMYIPVTSENRVARYDPVNRMFLGGFNAPGARRVMSGNEQLGVIRVSPGGYRFNMFNGLQLGYIPTPVESASYDRTTGSLLQLSTNNIIQVNIGTGISTGQTLTGTGGGIALSANRFQSGQFALARNDGGVLRATMHLNTGALIATASTFNVNSASSLSNSIQWRNRSGSDIITSAYYDTTASAWRLLHMSRTSTGVFTSALFSMSGNFSSAQPVSLAPSHNGFYIVGADGTNPGTLTRIVQYDDDSFGVLYDSWTVNLNVSGNSNFGVGMVIAPEPGTMIALGAGVVALLRRRKK